MSEIKSRRNFDHRQAKIEIVYDDKYRKVIQCDRGIAAIIKALNENGCDTLHSCQDGVGGCVWINFTLQGTRKFWRLIKVGYVEEKIKSSDYHQLLEYEWSFATGEYYWGGDSVSLRFDKKKLKDFRRVIKACGIRNR